MHVQNLRLLATRNWDLHAAYFSLWSTVTGLNITNIFGKKYNTDNRKTALETAMGLLADDGRRERIELMQ